MMRVAIVGYGSQGRSAYDYYHDTNQVTVCDQAVSLELPDDVIPKLGADYLHDLEQFDIIVRSPSIHPRDIVNANSEAILAKVTTVSDEFLRVCPSKHTIGVTGTKGKGTTSTLITRLLEGAGKRVHLGGNIGTPPLDLLKDNIGPDDWVVLELANFQLIDIKHSPHIAVCLMVVPEHLNWHADMEEYIAAKQQLFAHQTADDIAVYYQSNANSTRIASVGSARKIPYLSAPGAIVQDEQIVIDGQPICGIHEIKLLGKHNWQNVCAAVTAVWQITQDVESLHATIQNFGGLPYRTELRATFNGVSYYNDSFATGPGSCVAALEAIPEMKIAIIGGYDRGLDLTELGDAVADPHNHVRKVILIGQSAERVAAVLRNHDYHDFVISHAQDMPAIAQEASAYAESGDAVVLSPGFASFDMFKNFEVRGQLFNAALEQLTAHA